MLGLSLATLKAGTPAPQPPSAVEATTFASQLEGIRNKYHLPALAAVAVRGGDIAEIAATGLRRADHTERVSTDDLWHIGSCTKSMTATLAAVLVERGIIQWQSRIDEVFPEALANIHPAWHSVTLEQLLSHQGGAPAQPPEDIRREMEGRQEDATEQRRAVTKLLMERPPEVQPGQAFRYSDDGYAIAGAMLERRTRRSWEEMIRSELFTPLEMRSAGFGAPGHRKMVDQPWGHEGSGGIFRPIPPGPSADNPPVIGPAGTVHCSIGDLARYAAWHGRAGRAPGPGLITPKSFEKLHTPVRGDYALGWKVLNEDWAGGKALTHAGTNGYWYAVMWVAPERDTAFVAVTNCSATEAQQGCEDAITLLVERVIGVKRQ